MILASELSFRYPLVLFWVSKSRVIWIETWCFGPCWNESVIRSKVHGLDRFYLLKRRAMDPTYSRNLLALSRGRDSILIGTMNRLWLLQRLKDLSHIGKDSLLMVIGLVGSYFCLDVEDSEGLPHRTRRFVFSKWDCVSGRKNFDRICTGFVHLDFGTIMFLRSFRSLCGYWGPGVLLFYFSRFGVW